MKKEQDKLLGSFYDGIQEYDNDLPRWWLWLFYGTIIFAVVYVGYYHLGSGLSQEEELAVKMAAINESKKVAAATQKDAALDADGLLALAGKAEIVAKGKETFTVKCVACHNAQGQGLVGPNLTDNYWIHGGKITDIRNVIEVGVAAKGMIPWKGLLSDDEINAVTAFIWSIKGSNPPNPKEPQGEKVE